MKKATKQKDVATIVHLLRSNQPVMQQDYKFLMRNCTKIAAKAYHRYGINGLVEKASLREEVVEDIATMSLVKALKGFRPEKGAQFLSYYYNKASSAARVHAGKLKRRYKIVNTYPLFDESTYNED